jgi:hypothetical protein
MPAEGANIVLGDRRMDAGPDNLEPALALIEIGADALLVGRLGPLVEIDAPPPVRSAEGHAWLLQNASDRQPAPKHLPVVGIDLTVAEGGFAQGQLIVLGHAPL